MQLDLQLGRRAVLTPAEVRERLEAALGAAPPWRRRDPVSQLVRALIGSKTQDAVADAVLARLRGRFRRWEDLAGARPDEVLEVIVPVASAGDKAERLPRALAAVRRRFGALRFDGLAETPLEDAMEWLQALPGADQEVAASVLNASTLDRPVMIVDDAVLRVAVRLGWAAAPGDPGVARRDVMAAAPAGWEGGDFLALHRRLGALGQTLCRPERPRCDGCPLADRCPAGAARGGERAGAFSEGAGGVSRLRRRLEGLERPPVRRADQRTASLGWASLDEAFAGGALPAGLHQLAPETPVTATAAWLPPVAAASRLPASGAIRLVLVQEADARREGGAPYGPGLAALGMEPRELAVGRAARAADALGMAEAAVRLAAAPVVVVELRRGEALADLAATRRLDLLARRAGVFLFLLTPTLHATSAAVTRWRVGAAPSPGRRRRPGWPAVRLELVRNRAGRTGAWSLQWNPHERRFTAVAPLSAPVGAPVVDRPRAPGADCVATAA
ncbi:MAG: hypothetical protein INR64_09230 [Caulobacteraceae bacterium]|nr:hypothetical protein [Caulobacter sp.]